MKRLLLFSAAFFILIGTSATVSVINPSLKASAIFVPVGKAGINISLLDLSQIKVKDYEKLTDAKMNFFSRLGFKNFQRHLRNSIKKDGSIDRSKAEKFFTKTKDGQTGFHLGGFALGLFLGWFWGLGIFIAYLIKDEKRKNRIQWAWIGFLAAIALFLIIWIIAAGSDVRL
jgi:hypothetical protein